MFYAEAILSKKGPLAKVWLAAHLERKLTKAQLLQASIPSSVGAIISQDQGPPLALRLSGQLLLGVARIYARKARYLLEDCSEALVRIKLAFRPGAADITSDAVVAAHNAITLPEALTEFDILLPSPVHLHMGGVAGAAAEGLAGLRPSAALNTSRLQDITLAEQPFDISAVARGAGPGGEAALGEEDLLGRDDDFRLDLDEDFVLSPLPQEPHMDLDGSALEPEVGREAAMGLEESMVGIRAEDVSLAAKAAAGPEAGASMMDITHEELGIGGGDGDVLRFGDMRLAPSTQEAALQEAEAEVLAAGTGEHRLAKRRRLNLADLVSSEATSLSPDEIRGRLNDPTDIVRKPTYLPALRAARLEDMSSAVVAAQFLAPATAAPFSSLFGPAALGPEQQVPTGAAQEGTFALGGGAAAEWSRVLSPGLQEPLVPEHELDEYGLRFEEGGDELAFGAGLDESALQLEAGELLGNKSIEQLERLEEESFQRLAEEQRRQLGGVRLFADAAPGRDEALAAGAPLLAGRGIGEGEAAPGARVPEEGADGAALGGAAAGHSKNTVQAIRILDAAARASNVRPSDAVGAAADAASEGGALSFMDIAKDARRDDAVKLFFELLVLKTRDFIDVAQPAPYEDVTIVPRTMLGQAAAAAAAAPTGAA
ncbi:sister chromatid cohesion protein 1 [Coemansia biformis]|uniref:Sister chromatid cohesion protein 1 n=1 Tax=Coemansia biformis TaxID=1286918 RepID=A0A9W8CWX5_9FUNG|nr:sister chromatid cohesion protein 1 [Coemansia biformis]